MSRRRKKKKEWKTETVKIGKALKGRTKEGKGHGDIILGENSDDQERRNVSLFVCMCVCLFVCVRSHTCVCMWERNTSSIFHLWNRVTPGRNVQ